MEPGPRGPGSPPPCAQPPSDEPQPCSPLLPAQPPAAETLCAAPCGRQAEDRGGEEQDPKYLQIGWELGGAVLARRERERRRDRERDIYLYIYIYICT